MEKHGYDRMRIMRKFLMRCWGGFGEEPFVMV